MKDFNWEETVDESGTQMPLLAHTISSAMPNPFQMKNHQVKGPKTGRKYVENAISHSQTCQH